MLGLSKLPETVPRELLLPRGRRLVFGRRPLVMAVLNLTPDSFSDGGLYTDPERAVARGLALLEEGADLLDLGAESTRPGGGVYGAGAREVRSAEELARLAPVLTRLRAATDAPISVDTRKGAVAAAALAEGADLVNDVSALSDPALGEAVAGAGCPLVLMHSRGELSSMQRDIHYDDLLADVRGDLEAAMRRAAAAGIAEERLILDPGIGFAKTAAHNLELLRRLDALRPLGRPLVVGASRKSFIGAITGAPVERRLPGSLAAAAWAAAQGAEILRVHDVAETVDFLRVWAAIEGSGGGVG